MYKIFFLQLCFFLFFCGSIAAQKASQEPSNNQFVNLSPDSYFSFSSNTLHEEEDTHEHDPKESCKEKGFRHILTLQENSPWWQAEFSESVQLNNLQLLFKAKDYPTGLNRFYIFMSNYPIEHTDINALLSSPAVEHIYIEGEITPNTIIPLGKRTAQYLRVQSAKPTQFNFPEVKIMGIKGLKEIPDNNIDDDLDGYTDNKDKDLFPVFRSVVAVPPSCMDCHDAMIHIVAGGERLSLSTDGGISFRPLEAEKVSIPVEAGIYQLVLSTSNGTTIEYPKNPVTVPGSPDMIANCANGDFINGFTGWSGGQGTAVSGTINNQTISAPRQVIIPSGTQFDPNVSAIPLQSPSGQSQFARLGTTILTNVDNLQRLTYSFLVTEQNYNFRFNHAAVLNLHPSGGATVLQAFFNWTLRSGSVNIATKTLNPTNGTMIPWGNGVMFSNWQSECVNLWNFIGRTVTIDFTTSSCSFGFHGGYAYIDGLCQPTAKIAAPKVQAPSSICSNQTPTDIYAIQSISTQYNSYAWKVEKIGPNGQPIPGTSALGPLQSQLPITPLTNFLAFWSSITGQQPQCGDVFRTTLIINDMNCNIGSNSATTTFLCSPPPLDYCDIAVCNNAGSLLQTQSTGANCADCTYAWSPQTNLSNPSIMLPTISNPGGLNTTYNVVATAANGCVSTASLEVWDATLSGTLTAQTVCINLCEVALEVYYETNKPFNLSRVNLSATSYNGTLLNTTLSFNYNSVVTLPNGFKRYKFVSNSFENKGLGFQGNTPEPFIITMKTILPSGFCNFGNCPTSIGIGYNVPRGLFHGEPNVYIPNIFYANDPNPVNRYFNPFFSDGILAPGVYWAEMKIYDQWGGLMYENTTDGLFEASCSSTHGLNGDEPGLPYNPDQDVFPWNGKESNNGKWCEQGVYTYWIRFKNCKFENGLVLAGDVLFIR